MVRLPTTLKRRSVNAYSAPKMSLLIRLTTASSGHAQSSRIAWQMNGMNRHVASRFSMTLRHSYESLAKKTTRDAKVKRPDPNTLSR